MTPTTILRWPFLLCLALLALVSERHAGAQSTVDAIEVTSGFLDMRLPTGSILMAGSRGFLAESVVSTADGVFGPAACNGSPQACVAGAAVDLAAFWVGGDVRGTAAVDGRVYTSLGSAASMNQMALRFAGAAVLPPRSGFSTTVQAPFEFSGTFDHADAAGAPMHETLSGEGVAIVSLTPNVATSEGWSVIRVLYAFGTALPPGWATADLGDVGVSGQVRAAGNQFTVAGAGADVWGTSDGLRFAFASLPGDGDVVARVDSQQSTDPFAKAGVMMRAGTDPGAAHTILDVKPDGGLEFMTRTVARGETTFIAGAAVQYPIWLKLRRSGNLITGSYSNDGVSWSVLGATEIDGVRFAGIVVTSHNRTLTNDAVFTGSAVTDGGSSGLPPGWSDADIGAVGFSGSTAFSSAGFSIAAAGADVWGASDSFRYVFRSTRGVSWIRARVEQLEDTHVFAKAGVMIRSGTAPDAAAVILDVRPSGEIEFMSRTTAGTTMTYEGGTFTSYPAWLMLQRSGGKVIGYTSADGQSWTSVGSVDMALPADALVGLAVTSHDPARATHAFVTDVLVGP